MKEAPYEIHMKIERLILSGCEVSIQTNEGGAHVPAFCTKEQVARQLWLLYYNRALLERGVISEKEHNQMIVKIQSNTAGTKKNKT